MAFPGGLLRAQESMRGDLAAPDCLRKAPESEFDKAFREEAYGSGDGNLVASLAPREESPRASGLASPRHGAGDASVWNDDERSADLPAAGASRDSTSGDPLDYTRWGCGRVSRPDQPLAPLIINEALKRMKRSSLFPGDPTQAAGAPDATGPARIAFEGQLFPSDASAAWDGWSDADSNDDRAEELA
jgi:hypothetical protein